ncbi:hypothetical protein BOM_0890 (plasmid) [Borrelia miyamotoi FR64b]|nr:hypothetical protein BOM_0890 [Borrelia miyamotoi FR64b]
MSFSYMCMVFGDGYLNENRSGEGGQELYEKV